jgi:hypothetical protein
MDKIAQEITVEIRCFTGNTELKYTFNSPTV